MAVRVGNLIFADWQTIQLPGGWSDTFMFPVSYQAGLPPGDYARAIQRMILPLVRLRKSASLWIVTDAPGTWFTEELRARLRGLRVPFAVAQGNSVPRLQEFSFFPWTDRQPSPRPPEVPPLFETDFSAQAVSCLQILGRIGQGYTAEIASLAGISLPTAREVLQELMEQGLVVYLTEVNEEWKYPRWLIKRSGVSLTLRSWGIPPGIAFDARKERGITRSRLRRTARLWPAWVRQASQSQGWPDVEIWGGWSEVNLGNPYPDALCWGPVAGEETLFWLEVERGNRLRPATTEELRRKLIFRFNRALVYVRSFSTRPGVRLRLLFALLGPERVQKAAQTVFDIVPEEAAVVLENWNNFGNLPTPAWGRTH